MDTKVTCTYGSYSILKDALFACERDSNCGFVHNDRCSDMADFKLCHQLETHVSTSYKSCIYSKGSFRIITLL